MSKNKLFGTNLDANMVIEIAEGIQTGDVIRIDSDLFNVDETFYKVKGIELGKSMDNGRRATFDWEKDKLTLQMIKGVQVLADNVENNEFVYDTDYGTFYYGMPLKKNLPVLIEGTLYLVSDVEKTGKKSGNVVLGDFEVRGQGKHLYKDVRFDVESGGFVLKGFGDTFGDYLKLKRVID